MKNEEFERVFDAVVKQERETLIEKSRDYAGGGDRLWNFRAGAGISGGTPEQALWGYLTKHLVSIRDICNGKEVTRAQLREKIGDARNYLVLLEALVIDEIRLPLDKATE